ncbi:unnamed protein product, partial [Adineta steineri]
MCSTIIRLFILLGIALAVCEATYVRCSQRVPIYSCASMSCSVAGGAVTDERYPCDCSKIEKLSGKKKTWFKIELPNGKHGYVTDAHCSGDVPPYEILRWSSSIDVAEQYQYYLDQPFQSNLSDQIFLNCTSPWRGSRCQYALKLNEDEFVRNSFEMTSTDNIFQQTCYIHLKCDRGGPLICLDWREICNGRIDCLNDGIDETGCFNLEMNECNENEYRCHNGLCIPKKFLKMEFADAQCLDGSDEIVKNNHLLEANYRPHLFECQEYVCGPDEGQFTCGDGQCVEDFGQCQNNRHLALTQSISVQGNLSYSCWIVMLCLSKIMTKIGNITCDQFIQSSKIIEEFKNCTFPLEFPVIPVLFGHVRFLYDRKEIDNINTTLALKPDYVCYDEQLCD